MATKNGKAPGRAVATRPPKGGAVVRADFMEKLKKFATQAVETEASVQTGSFISLAAGVMEYQGSPVPDNQLDVVVVDAQLENAYYEGAYDPDNKQPPVCYAFGRNDKEMAPHPESPEPQSEKCSTCKWNQFGTAVRNDGKPGKGKACKNIRRIALIPKDHTGSAEDVAKAEVAFMKLPVTSVKGWAAYVRTLGALHQRPPQAVVTNIKCVPDKDSQFKVVFDHVEDIDDEDVMEAVIQKHEEIQDQMTAAYPKPSEEEAPAPRGRASKAAKGAKPAGRRF